MVLINFVVKRRNYVYLLKNRQKILSDAKTLWTSLDFLSKVQKKRNAYRIFTKNIIQDYIQIQEKGLTTNSILYK